MVGPTEASCLEGCPLGSPSSLSVLKKAAFQPQTFLKGLPGPEVDGQMGPTCVSGQGDPERWGGTSEQSRGWEKPGGITCQLETQLTKPLLTGELGSGRYLPHLLT